jgi:hypothetical protein
MLDDQANEFDLLMRGGAGRKKFGEGAAYG